MVLRPLFWKMETCSASSPTGCARKSMGQPPRRSGQSSSLVSQMLRAPDRWSLRYSRRGAEGKISHSTQRSEQCRVALCDAAKKQPERKALPSAPVPRRVQDVNSATLTYANASVSILNQRLSFPTIPLQNLTRPGGRFEGLEECAGVKVTAS